MSTDDAATNVEQHDAKVKAGGDKLQAQSEQKLDELSSNTGPEDNKKNNEESKPTSAADDQPDDSDPS